MSCMYTYIKMNTSQKWDQVDGRQVGLKDQGLLTYKYDRAVSTIVMMFS
jgi:hypothetical protein